MSLRVRKIVWVLLIMLSLSTYAQSITTQLQSNEVALGQPNMFELKIRHTPNQKIEIAPPNKLLPYHFEVIKDSIIKTNFVYTRRIEFAIFEEGEFTLPSLDIQVGDQTLTSVPYQIKVINTAQEGDQIYDIMQNKSVKRELRDYWELYKWYFLGFLILIALLITAYMLIRYGRLKASSPIVAKNITLKKLNALKNKKYIESGDYRSFYVEIIDIIREFLTRQYHFPANVLLTDDLIEFMKKNNTISSDNEKVVEEVFLRGDLVKFAKIFPDSDTMLKDLDETKKMVKRSVDDIEFENLRKDV